MNQVNHFKAKFLSVTAWITGLTTILFSFGLLFATPDSSMAQELPPADRPATKLQYSKWSGDLNVPDPVSIAFDAQGRAYVTQTQRRKSQDLDIRQNTDWIPNDLSFQTVEDKRNFYLSNLNPNVNSAPGEANSKHVGDQNKDGQHDFHDLKVLSERIHLLEDTNNDGTADKIGLWAEDFKTEVTGIGAGVLAHQGKVYATVAPDVWKLEDTDGDGKADKREVLATGFGLHIAYAGHDMHGLTVGPDGKIYWSIGDKGISATSKEGKRFHYPNQGGVMRCNPDGSDFEVFAHGLRNVQELAFDQHGNLFGFDNDSDQPKERERFVHIVEGMDAGWRCNYQYRGNGYNPWMEERMWEPLTPETSVNQPAYIIPPISNSVNGPCGFAFNPGTALSADYKDYFFLTSTLGGEQISFTIEPNGDSYRMVNEHQIGKGIAMIGINFGPDGGLYGVDWAGGYPLNKKGHVWKIDATDSDLSKADKELRKQTSNYLKADFSRTEVVDLVGMLSFPDQRVRLKSQFELVHRKKVEALVSTLNGSRGIRTFHATWALGQLARDGGPTSKSAELALKKFIAELSSSLSESMPKTPNASHELKQMLANAIRTYGDIPNASPIVMDKLNLYTLGNLAHQIKIQTALANAKLGNAKTFQSLVTMIEKLRPEETYLRHAVTTGLAGIEYKRLCQAANGSATAEFSSNRLEQLAEHQNEQVRLFGAIAIRKLSVLLNNDSQQLQIDLQKYLTDSNESVATETARAIHDDFSIKSALQDLAKQLNETKVKQKAFLLRALNANYRLGDAKSLERVVKFATDNLGNEMGIAALECLKSWGKPAVLDRVTGRYRTLPEKRIVEKQAVKPALITALRTAIESNDQHQTNEATNSTVALISTLGGLEINIPEAELLQIADSQLPAAVRAQALSSFANQIVLEDYYKNRAEYAKVLAKSLKSKSKAVRIAGLKMATRFDHETAVQHIASLLQDSDSPLDEKQFGLKQLSQFKSPAATALLKTLKDNLESGKFSPALYLELWETTLDAGSKIEIRRQIIKLQSQRMERTLSKLNLKPKEKNAQQIAEYFECLSGGDPKRGKSIFNTNIDAQCARCHRIGKNGSDVGPDLTQVANREPAKSDPYYLLRSIVAPSSQIDEKYQTVMFLLDTGKSVKGILVREDDNQIVIADESGKEIVIQIDEIEDEARQEISIMPVAKTLSKRDIRDLVAYLKTLKRKKK